LKLAKRERGARFVPTSAASTSLLKARRFEIDWSRRDMPRARNQALSRFRYEAPAIRQRYCAAAPIVERG
jgi:hypothetical protein